MKKYKSMYSYDFLKNGSVGKILQFAIKKGAPFKKKKINSDFDNKWVLCDMVGTILNDWCSCMAGNTSNKNVWPCR